VADAVALKSRHGFSGFPVTESGESGSRLLGLITERDFDFVEYEAYETAISEVSHPA